VLVFLKNKLVLHNTILQILIIFAFASASIYVYSFCLLYLFLYIVIHNKKCINRNILIPITVYITLVFLMTFFKLCSDPSIFIKSFVALFGFYCALLLLDDFDSLYYSSLISLIIFQLFVIFNIFIYGFENFPNESPLEKIFNGKSGNGITSNMIVLQIHYFFLHILKDNKFNFSLFFTILLTLLISMSTYARGSLVSSFALLMIFFFGFGFSVKKLLFLVVVITLVVTLDTEMFLDFFNRYTKLSQGFSDHDRIAALTQYLRKIDLLTFFYGADYNDTIIVQTLNGNPHNSFIRAHHNYGIFYIFYVIGIIFISVFNTKSIHKVFLYSALSSVLIFRLWTEPVLFPTIFDFYFFSMFFSVIIYEKRTATFKSL